MTGACVVCATLTKMYLSFCATTHSAKGEEVACVKNLCEKQIAVNE